MGRVRDLVKVDGYEVAEGFYYHKEHLWVKIKNGKAKIGMTDFSLKNLREIVYVEIGKVGDSITKNETFGNVESTKAVLDLIAPISGTIEKINEVLASEPNLLNEDPYGEGWIAVVAPTSIETELKELMDFNSAVEWHKELAKGS